MKSSFLGTVKDKLSRKSSNASQRSTTSQRSAGEERGRSLRDGSRSPLTNPSAPTRRPGTSASLARSSGGGESESEADRRAAAEAPPPSYAEATGPGGRGVPAPRDVSPAPSGASAISVASLTTPEDPYAFLSTFDTVFLIDDSGSMAGRSWREVKTVLANITPICTSHDADGVDVFFLNHKSGDAGDAAEGKAAGGYNVTTDEAVERLFDRVRPTAATPTGTRINAILKPYLRHYEDRVRATGDADGTGVKPVNMIVITDGVPTDDLEGVLLAIAKKLDKLEAPPFQVGIQFFQVGNELSAAEALRDLDDHLGRDVRDMVDTVSWNSRDGAQPALTADAILKTVLGAVVRRVDRRGVEEARAPDSRFLSARR